MFGEEENTFDAFNDSLVNPPRVLKKVRDEEDMPKMNMFRYIAEKKPMDAHLLINQFGKYRRARGVRELESQIKHFVRNNQSVALQELAKIHPDRELIIEEYESTREPIKEVKEDYRNVDGQSLTTAPTNITQDKAETINMSKIMIWSGFVLLGMAIIMKK
jgi:hypothetical protein